MSDKIKKKIAALMAKAESATNVHEAELFLDKAYELMNLHQIQAFELDVDDLIEKRIVLAGTSGVAGWKVNLFTALAKFYGGEILIRRRGRSMMVSLVGKESACITVEIMYPFILKQIKREAKKLRDGGYGNLQQMTVHVANSTSFRIADLIKRREAQAAPVSATGTGLVVKDEMAAYFDAKYPDIKSARRARATISAASDEAAKNISLFRQAESKAAGQVLIENNGGGV